MGTHGFARAAFFLAQYALFSAPRYFQTLMARISPPGPIRFLFFPRLTGNCSSFTSHGMLFLWDPPRLITSLSLPLLFSDIDGGYPRWPLPIQVFPPAFSRIPHVSLVSGAFEPPMPSFFAARPLGPLFFFFSFGAVFFSPYFFFVTVVRRFSSRFDPRPFFPRPPPPFFRDMSDEKALLSSPVVFLLSPNTGFNTPLRVSRSISRPSSSSLSSPPTYGSFRSWALESRPCGFSLRYPSLQPPPTNRFSPALGPSLVDFFPS